jgi:nicotinamidase-related amidase
VLPSLGLATDYCVRASVLDGCKYSDVFVVNEGIKEITTETKEKAVAEMTSAGSYILSQFLSV